ncbi:MAG TPA: damage-inducible protein CinA [Firmicutes bacterium]|nr:damage-inducible protein CinA [Bacillota bacterium]
MAQLDEGILNLVRLVKGVMGERRETLSSCESLTGGLFGAYICSVPGASDFYRGGAITYCDSVKNRLGVSAEVLKTKTAISGECAEEMALAAARFTDSDWCVSFTVNAGPTAQDHAPVGCVFIGVAYHGRVKVSRLQLEGERNDLRLECVREGLRLLCHALADAA